MFRSTLLRGVSAGAISFIVFSTITIAQESLPTIEIGKARHAQRTTAPARSNDATRAAATAPAAASPVLSLFATEPKTAAEGYVVHNASAGTKTDVPIRQTPVSVHVVPKQVIADQNITTVQDALENISSVRSNNNEVEGYNFKIRGFDSRYIYRNSLAIPTGEGAPSMLDTANLERIEVLKGPASILYGRAEPGGLINLVTKQPLDKPRYVVEQQIGSFDHYRTQWDVSSPVSQVPGLAYRVSGAHQNNGSFRSFSGGGERFLVAPVMSYRTSEWTEFTVEGQYLGEKAQSDVGIPPIGPGPAPIALSRPFQEANDPRDRIESYNIGYKFRQNLNEDWKVTNRFLYTGAPNAQKPNITLNCVTLLCVDTDGRTLQRISQFQSVTGRAYSTNIDLEGKFTALGGKHDFLMGLDYLNNYYNYYFSNGATLYPIDIYNPVYGTVPSFAYLDAKIGTGFKGHSSVLTRQKGFYVQDHIIWSDRLHLLVGARYDVADVTRGVSNGDFDAATRAPLYNASKELAIADRLRARTNVDTSWTPRAGLVYDLLPQLSIYGSYSRSFGVNNGFSASKENLGPQRGLQWEVGLKADPLPGLTATLAFFQITKSGVPTRDFASTDPTAVKLAGLQRSRGIEFDVIGRVTDRLSLVANYSHIDAKVISDNPKDPLNPFGSGLYGNHLDNVPRHSGKVFAIYDFGENGLGWRVGAGVTASTRAWGDLQNTFLMPGWARLDGFASYTTLYEGHKITAQLNLQNINNAQYFTGVDNYFNYNVPPLPLFPAKPFTATGTVRFEW
jgi:iron complex outermembrane receptor protein